MRELVTEIEIEASPARVWRVLSDLEAYPEWNRFIRSITGELKVGSTLNVRIEPESGPAAQMAPIVVAVEPERRFAWKGKLGFGGLFDGMHEFIIEPISETRVRFVQREEFTGILVPVIWPILRKGTTQGFKEMNEALRKRAEGN